MEYLKLLQFVWWFPEWHGFHFLKGDPVKLPVSFHVIYKWSILLGYFEIRRFLTESERKTALYFFHENQAKKQRLTDESLMDETPL